MQNAFIILKCKIIYTEQLRPSETLCFLRFYRKKHCRWQTAVSGSAKRYYTANSETRQVVSRN